ncbi:MAG: DUF1330 domain-containing protein [Thermomicrobia bacterium]|nr:DUF1330 domain-containing protein [Thermomicrobia bacterium]
MAAYLIAGVKSISDQAGFEEYRRRVGATMEPYGARYFAAAPPEGKEGNWSAMVTAIIEFPSLEALKEWYDCAAYQELKQLRQRSADVDVVFVEGV